MVSKRPDKRLPAPLPRTISVQLSREEADSLVSVADFYRKNWGFMRGVVAFTSVEMRRRLHFIADESKILQQFLHSEYGRQFADGHASSEMRFTPRALIALWGRLLASLHSPRGRRKLSHAEIERREALAFRFGRVVLDLSRHHPEAIDTEISTRRPAEQAWMRAALEGQNGG